MNSPSRPCTPGQPMYCKKEELSRLYRQSKSILPAENLINSPQMEIIDGINWSFDPNTQTIWNDRYWKGFYPADYDFANLVMMYGLGFFKRFWATGICCSSQTPHSLHPFFDSDYWRVMPDAAPSVAPLAARKTAQAKPAS